MSRWLAAIDRALLRVEDLLLVTLLAGMIALSLTSMVLRWLGSGLAPIDPLLRHGVLWLGLLGGVAATRSGRHVQIGAVARLLPPWAAALSHRLLAAVSAGVCAVLAHASWRFVIDERAAGTQAFGGLPLWILQLVLPGGMILLTLRFLLQLTQDPPPPEGAQVPEGIAAPPPRPGGEG